MSAMNGPVYAAVVPGVCVSGRIVSAISSRKAKSWALNFPGTRAAAEPAFSTAANRSLPPTNATPPNSALTRRMASRRLIRCSCSVSVSDDSFIVSDDAFICSSQVAAIELVHRKVHRASSERHIGERGILTGAGDHAGAVRDKYIRCIPHLIVRVEHRSLWIASHPCRPHFVDGHPRISPGVECLDRFRARLLEYLSHVSDHVLAHQALVLAGGAIDFEDR